MRSVIDGRIWYFDGIYAIFSHKESDEKMTRPDEARSLTREIFTSAADLIPDEQARTLTVKLHHLTNHASDEAIRHLAQFLNDSETIHPGTNLRLIYQFVSNHFPPD